MARDTLDGTAWTVTRLHGAQPETPVAPAPTMRFEYGRVSGSDGCNHIGGSWEQDGDTIIFSDMLITLMACMDVDVWLEDPRTATIDGDTMVVYGPDDVELGELHRA